MVPTIYFKKSRFKIVYLCLFYILKKLIIRKIEIIYRETTIKDL